ncbi:protein translocase subunit SecD [Desulfovibrio cuneatus]|uniref:protein translocase subunit SecD n=1 Tax=Desulfovibrio cuneatus TaxID=159728 RepID=UPI0004897B04|nr:protein translocase subunit SecD [Desulfovibrio cuneatus]
MKQGILWRVAIVLLVLCASAYVMLPDMLSVPRLKEGEQPQGLARFLPNTRVNLGLDLLGGIHLTLGVDMEKAIEANLSQVGQELLAEASRKGLLITAPQLAGERLEFVLTVPGKQEEFEELLKQKFHSLAFEVPKTLANGRLRYSLALTELERQRFTDSTLDQALSTIRNRIDQFGVAEPDVRKQQDGRIVVQLPGMDDSNRAIGIIGKTAHLEFRLVVDPATTKGPTEQLPYVGSRGDEAKGAPRFITVEKEVSLTGDHIENAVVGSAQYGDYEVAISFDRRGSELFGRLTEANLQRNLAIVLDGKVHSAPVIQAKLTDNASITGNFTLEEATDLALVLRAGSLPAPVKVLEERSVGPSLGQESITQGVTAALVGGAIVMLFMMVYYGFSGVIANFMLLFDVLLILAGMALFGATLTLPGIAGIVLTIGMAVDANVLVFERIREEMRRMSPLEAIEAGFSRATLAIVDSNLTTIIAAVILYQFGTGPIRGFAVTLTLGIIASMFTAIFVSRVIFTIWMRKPGRKLSI